MSTPPTVSHSQMVMAFHPRASSSATFLTSRAVFASNLFCQNSVRVFGVVVRRQPTCRCQKHPCTNITAFLAGKTISGEPGKSRRCNRKRYPRECRSRLTTSSGLVFLPRTFAISADRAGSISGWFWPLFGDEEQVLFDEGFECGNDFPHIGGGFRSK